MVAMRVMQVAVDEVINMIPVRDGGMTAAGAMNMAGLVACAAVSGRAGIRVGRCNGNDMLINMVAMGMMQMAVMQIIDMIAVTNSDVTTAGAVFMLVVGVVRQGAVAHGSGSFK